MCLDFAYRATFFFINVALALNISIVDAKFYTFLRIKTTFPYMHVLLVSSDINAPANQPLTVTCCAFSTRAAEEVPSCRDHK